MRRPALAILGVVLLAIAGFAAYAWYEDGRGAADAGPAAGPMAVPGTPVERGRYLATAADCMPCHTRPGGTEFAGGRAFRLSFGTIYATNLTPDAATGIGGYSEEEFVRAVRSGIGRGGRHVYPAHPYTSYAAMARDDVLAIRAYLMSIPAVASEAPASDLSFPFSQRWLMPLWNALYRDRAGYRPEGARDEQWNRGAYLATALGHCGECHTPRNAAFGLKRSQRLSGTVTQGWKAYDITPSAESGIGAWSRDALAQYLREGHANGHGIAAGPMQEVISYSTSRLSAEDRAALVAYLLPEAAAKAPVAPTPAVAAAAMTGGLGAALYSGTCAGCHPLGGDASLSSFADLRGARTVRDPQGTNLLQLLGEGSAHGAAGASSMPGFGRGYGATERAALANYVLAQWGGIAAALTPNDARKASVADAEGGSR
jgi:mono/diheme cytochrome c family protein